MTGPALACPQCGEHFAEAFEHCPQDGSRLGQLDALCGRELGGRYFILTCIGKGAQGAVYAASDERLHRRVALKVLHPEVARRPAQLERFRQELKTLTLLGHEHIVDVTDLQKDDEQLYFAMEHLRGQTLEALLARVSRLPLEQVVHITEQCCRALATAHARGIVHHDLKPANVFLISREGRSDFVKLLDFGMDKLQVGDGGRAGEKTPPYTAPEQRDVHPADARADQYALGVMMFEMLTGSVPFGEESALHVLSQHVETPPRRIESMHPGLEVPSSIESVVRRALKQQPSERFADIGSLSIALHDAVRAQHDEQLHGAFRAYNVPLPSTEAQRRMASVAPDSFALLDSLRRTLGDEQHRVLAEQREAYRRTEQQLEQRIATLEAQQHELRAQLLAARGDRPPAG